VYRLDEVPSIPPLPDYQQTQSGLWIQDGAVLLQARASCHARRSAPGPASTEGAPASAAHRPRVLALAHLAPTSVLQDRPNLELWETNWDDHTCDIWENPDTGEVVVGYVPQLQNATRVTVPAWVFTATLARR
jgi:hypothetical protein